MLYKAAIRLGLTLVPATFSLRPESTSICDYYTPLITGRKNSASSQLELMLKITHTFVLGNYTTPNVGIAVHGVATPGTWDGHEVYLLPYFDGGYASTNDGGSHGVVKNFLDGGGAAPLLENEPAYDTSSNQYTFLNHVYQYFGEFYSCSYQGDTIFPKYQGVASMFEVHKYMDVDKYQMDFFNQQITLAVASLGFEEADVDFTNTSLYKVFSNRCTPPATVIPPSAGEQLQSICIAGNCPLDPQCACAAYPRWGMFRQPAIANATLVGNVTQENETSAATTAAWPTRCGQVQFGTATGCEFANSHLTGAETASQNVAGKYARFGTLLDVILNLLFIVFIGNL